MDTLVQNILDAEKNLADANHALIIAPAAKFNPLSIFKDEYSEEYNYPTLYFGQKRPLPHQKKITYQDQAKGELQSADRRFALHIPNIFFKTIKILIHILFSAIYIRKGKLQGRQLTAHDIAHKPNLDETLKTHMGYRDLQCL